MKAKKVLWRFATLALLVVAVCGGRSSPTKAEEYLDVVHKKDEDNLMKAFDYDDLIGAMTATS